MSHISKTYLCPDCDCLSDNAHQCPCGNRLNLINMANTVLNRKPLLAETIVIIGLFKEVMKAKVSS